MQLYITNDMIIQSKQNMRFAFFKFFFVRGRQHHCYIGSSRQSHDFIIADSVYS